MPARQDLLEALLWEVHNVTVDASAGFNLVLGETITS